MPDLTLISMQQCQQLEVMQAHVGKYVVFLLTPPDDWRCSCPSFRYERGLDDHGYCKHIRAHLEERCTWHEIYGMGQTDEERENMICPECGGETEWVQVGV